MVRLCSWTVVNVFLIFKFPSSYLRFSSSSTTYPKRGGPIRPVQNTYTGTEGFHTPPPSAGCSPTMQIYWQLQSFPLSWESSEGDISWESSEGDTPPRGLQVPRGGGRRLKGGDLVRTDMCFPHSVGHKKGTKDTLDDDRGWDHNMSLSDWKRCLSLSTQTLVWVTSPGGTGIPVLSSVTGCTLCVHGVYVLYKVPRCCTDDRELCVMHKDRHMGPRPPCLFQGIQSDGLMCITALSTEGQQQSEQVVDTSHHINYWSRGGRLSSTST